MHVNGMAEKHILLWLQPNFIPLTKLSNQVVASKML